MLPDSDSNSQSQLDLRTLRHISLFAELSYDALTQVEALCRWEEYDAGKVVVDLNDTNADVYFVVSGKVRVTTFLTEDIQISLADLEPGDTFGELSAVDRKRRSARVSAITPSTLARISDQDFRQVLVSHPDIAMALLQRFGNLIRNLNMRMAVMGSMTPSQRVYHELIRLSEPDTQNNGNWIIASAPSHTELSSWSGSDKQTVAAAIGNLARDGVIERQNKDLVIKDYEKLQTLIRL